MNWGSANTHFLEIDDGIRDHSYKRVSMMCRRVVRPRLCARDCNATTWWADGSSLFTLV
jgi:hypothetical protein